MKFDKHYVEKLEFKNYSIVDLTPSRERKGEIKKFLRYFSPLPLREGRGVRVI